jgi:hypothetical protein
LVYTTNESAWGTSVHDCCLSDLGLAFSYLDKRGAEDQ